MGVQEKKAIRASTETLESATNDVCEKSGLKLVTEIDFSSIENDSTVLQKAAVIPGRILDYIGELTSDADYKEAFETVKSIKFIPASDDGFDYESSVTLNKGKMTVSYLPMQSMHGGYERAIKKLF